MLTNFFEKLPSTRIHAVSVVLGAGASNILVPLGLLTMVQTVVIKSSTVDATLKFGGTGESAIPILAQEVRFEIATDTLHLSTTTAGTVVLELHGR